MLIALSDSNDNNWGVFVYHDGSERVLYTMRIDYPVVATKSIVLNSFNGSFKLMIGTDGTLYTYPINRKGEY